MMLIGTSFGACLNSILSGEVSEDDVLLIITRTRLHNINQVAEMAETYYTTGNPYARKSINYVFDKSKITLEQVTELAIRLYENGKIHQPRTFQHGSGFIHPEITRDAIWMEVSPVGLNKNVSVIEAYEKYKVLDALTK